jgi:ferredoxin-NADP reductase
VSVPNPDQLDSNGNGIGDLCEAPDGVTFTLGGPASAPVQGTAGQYTLLGGSFGGRPTLMSNGSYTLHAFPSR